MDEESSLEEFSLLMTKAGKFSPWFLMLLVLANLPGLCLGLLSFIFVKDDNSFMVICNIPEIQNVAWSHSEIHNFTSDHLNTCKYRNYDYSQLSKLTFGKILEYSESLSTKPIFVNCKRYSTYSKTRVTIFSEFNLVCDNWSYYLTDSLGESLADIVVGILIIPLGDILGRRRLISWGIISFFAGDVFVAFASSHITIGMGWFLISSGYRLIKLSTEIIVFEMANSSTRKVFFLLTFIGTPLGYTFSGILYDAPYHWRHLFLTTSCSMLLLPLIEWYYPESPLWMMSKNRKTKAFAILHSIRQPEIQEELLLRYQNFDYSYLRTFKNHLQQKMTSISFAKCVCVALLFALIRITFIDTSRWKFMDTLKPHEKLFIFGLFAAQIAAVLLALPIFLITTRGTKFAITTVLVVAGLFFTICYFIYNRERQRFVVTFVLANMFSCFSFLCASFYILEAALPSHRATIAGLITSTGAGIAKLCLLLLVKFVKVEHLCLILAATSIIGASFPFTLKNLNDVNQ